MNPSTSALSTEAALEWDEVRSGFASSIMIDTPLSSLAQNLDGLDWPLTGENETAAAYIDFSYAELVDSLTRRGQPGAASLLVQILRETLAFDEPFGEMVKQTQASADRDSPMVRALHRLGIPEAFPLELTLLDDTSRQLCRLEQAWTIGEFTLLAQRLAQGVIVGGDLRRLLNALVQVDEPSLAELLPYRVGATGLHLAEALGQATRRPDAAEHAIRAITWFDAEFAEWRAAAGAGRQQVRRQLAVLNDESVERRAFELIAPHLLPEQAGRSSGLWSTLKRWFRP